MEIAGLTAAQHADYLALVNAEIRPEGATTRAEDDFPLALGADNLPWQLGAWDAQGRLAAGLAVLVRRFATSCGAVAVGMVGSVVTRPDCRGAGLSGRLQEAALARLRQVGVPLAALWTDRPEIYAGRGFVPAGWEWHVALAGIDLPPLPASASVRTYVPTDAEAVADLHALHPWRMLREPGDAAVLYAMPGTRGLVAIVDGRPAAAVFCGKGADFPRYVAEWNGPIDLVLGLLAAARTSDLAEVVFVPAGGELLVAELGARGGRPVAQDAGCWAVVHAERLGAVVAAAGRTAPVPGSDARAWLGGLDERGRLQPGPVTLAVWGLDSA
ncbi:MAG: GNAT family N-acetyltransferase [bacterium]|nr:GNAT family N-acetyltransferase [bacterium]